MPRRALVVAQSESDVRSPAVGQRALTTWASLFGLAAFIAGIIALTPRPTQLRHDPEVAPSHFATGAPRGAVATPARLANLTPSVIFADASTLSYRMSIGDDPPDFQAVVDSPTLPLDRTGSRRLGARAVVGACVADDSEGPTRDVTITWFFAADSSAPHGSGEYVLWQQRNDSTPVALVRHVLRDGHHPFLDYQYVLPSGDGADSIAIVPHTMLPISRADTVATPVDVRSLRSVEWHFLVVLDSTVHPTHMARVHVLTSLPAIDRLDRHECRESARAQPLLATANVGPPNFTG